VERGVSEVDVGAVVLPMEESQVALSRIILPAWTSRAASQERPVVVFVAGQPGSGKTRVADLVQAALEQRGGAVRVGSDLYKSAHRHYAELLAEDVRTAGVKVRADTRRWQAAVEERARAGRFDAVVETALADAGQFRGAVSAYREAGYRIEVVALATSEALSQLGVLERFVDQAVDGGGPRYVSWENHDGCAERMLHTLAAVEAEGLADRVLVVRRDAEPLYDNELVVGAWRRPAEACGVVAAERARPWTAGETARFRADLAEVDRRLHRELLDADRRLAVVRDSERAAALAEPVRRTAQARAEPPGVDYHRLSAEEHKWIFDELIVPSYLSGVTAHVDPVVVFIAGQPGAGKTRAARLVMRAMRARRPTLLTSDDFKVSHPDYFQLLQEEPRTAGARVRTDYQAWQAQAEAYVRDRRGDVVIETAPGSPEQFLASAEGFRSAGYRVELVVLAVRAADSRQGTAARYARLTRSGLPARFTALGGHDTCFGALADTVRAAEELQVADSVVVMRRDGIALYRAALTGTHDETAGPERSAGAAWALIAEQWRPYTLEEAGQFLALQRQVMSALPQHRDEVLAITRLAWPLLPPQLRPQWLTGSAERPRLLPLPAPRDGCGYGWVRSFSRAS
jgi:Ni2+-binding GTPase involved in maturation of urease and hydrogenase